MGLRGHSASSEKLVECLVGRLAVGDVLLTAATARRATSLEGPGQAHLLSIAEFGHGDVLPSDHAGNGGGSVVPVALDKGVVSVGVVGGGSSRLLLDGVSCC